MVDTRAMCAGTLTGFLAFLLAFAPGVCLAIAPSLQEGPAFPRSFRHAVEARQHHCSLVRLKSRDRLSCVTQHWWDHTLMVAIYDQHPQGRFRKTTAFCVPSWYGKARVRYVNLLGPGRTFLAITFEGNTGTGTLQLIQMYIGWNGTAFVPVYAETIAYTIGTLGFTRTLTVRTTVRHRGSAHVSVHLHFQYAEGQERDAAPTALWRSTAAWQNVLQWHAARFMFEEAGVLPQEPETPGLRPDWIQRNMSRTRATLRGLSVHDLCTSYLAKSGIMHILEAHQPEATPE